MQKQWQDGYDVSIEEKEIKCMCMVANKGKKTRNRRERNTEKSRI
jgi:hypothetical protein